MKNKNLTSLDPNQIQIKTFDEELDANRTFIVNWPEYNPITNMPPIPSVTNVDVKTIEVPTIIKEQQPIQVIEIPKIIYETKIERIEIPVIVKEVEIKEIEKLIIKESPSLSTNTIEKIVNREVLPLWVKCLLCIQTITLLGLLFIK